MAGWRKLASVVAVLAAAGPGWGQTYSLTEAAPVGKYFHVGVQMTLSGEMRVQRGDKKVPFKQTARAEHDFRERILEVGAGGLACKSVRFYKTARATLTVFNRPSERVLRAERSLLVAQRYKDQGLTYSPAGPLTREEVEVTEHFDTLFLPGLLAGKEVKVGDTWKVGNAVAQALCNFEGLTSQDLVGKLERVEGHVAHVSVSGKAAGIDLGALVKLTIQGSYDFDLKSHCLTVLQWKQKDERDQGPVSPASSAEVTVKLTRAVVGPCRELSDVALVPVPEGSTPPLLLTQVYYRDKEKRFELLHPREWQTVGVTPEHLVMRLMDRGDFVAQVTISPWTRDQPGKHMTPEAFQEAMAEAPGWEQDQLLQAGEVSKENGRWVYRISALGRMDNLKVMQNFYLVASPRGEQVVLVFTMTTGQAQKIGTRDLSLVGSLDFPSRGKDEKGQK